MRISKTKSVQVRVRTLKIRKYLSQKGCGYFEMKFDRNEVLKVRSDAKYEEFCDGLKL